jgi:hypothetical protein
VEEQAASAASAAAGLEVVEVVAAAAVVVALARATPRRISSHQRPCSPLPLAQRGVPAYPHPT